MLVAIPKAYLRSLFLGIWFENEKTARNAENLRPI